MSSKLFTPYPLPTQLRSSLFKTPTDGVVPPIDELEALHAELKNLKARTMEKARRAGEDLKVLEEGMRRMKDRAKKGKEREGKEKVKRERDFSTTPLPDFADDIQPLLSSSGASGSKPRLSSHPLNNLPSSSRSSMDPERDKKKKKKRKRDLLEESDIEMVDADSPRIRKGTPPIPHPSHSISSSSSIPPAPKAAKSISSSSIPKNSTQYHTGIDFTIPAPLTILPSRPPIQPPPIPAPSHPTLVSEDFSKIAKAPTQVAIAAFYSSVEPYLRVIKEEDVGFLSWEGDDIEPFVMPKLGRHYLEVWEEQDRLGLTTSSSALGTLQQVALNGADIPPNPSAVAPNPSFDPSTLSESDTQLEHLGHGPLTERLISALLPMPDSHLTWKGVKAAEDAMEGRPGGSGAAASRKEKLSVSDLERRIGDTMRWYNLLPSGSHVQPLDYSNKTDDPIATALRINQTELRRVSAMNRLRKARYAEVARDRVAWAEYLELRESIDRNITNVYNKLQKMQKAQRDAPKLGRKKKFKSEESTPVNGVNGSNGNGSVNGDTLPLPLCPAALGLGPDEDNQLLVSETLKQLVQTRRNWVKLGETLLDEKEGPLEVIELMEPGESSPEPNADDPSSAPGVNGSSSSKWRVPVMERPRRGRLVGFPKESIFKGIEEEVEELMRDWERHNVEREQAEGQAKIPTSTNSRVGATTVPHSNDTSTSGSGLKIHLNGHVQATYGKGKGKARDDQMDVG
ncbi:histone acetyltransferases subunit 3-domain-containing protein [Lentinula lateritia]|uniref:Histone acetyltransferases subunit 3-domain-containing protein n=1 Tax=Lentinula lateritia TaxID=40482 RepID=A0ABQ8V1B9_9AGAR|nr:histone acetyltransferases subunit 3-domain-containing protein [Lentinula lateritia]